MSILCIKSKKVTKENCLATLKPKIAEEWNYDRNLNVTPNGIRIGSDKIVWWKCSEGHEWQEAIKTRTKTDKKCPYCSGARVIIGKNDFASMYPEILKQWNYDRNKDISPDSIKSGSNKKVWWKCLKGHEWQATIINRVNGQNCPFCSNKKVLKGYNDFKTNNPILMKEWNWNKNKLIDPSDLSKQSNAKVWWKCSEGHEWQAIIYNRVNGQKCPFCSNKRILKGYNDFKSTNPELMEEWDYEKNDILPEDVSRRSSKSIWWICRKHKISFKASVYNRTKGTCCPRCSKEKGIINARKNIVKIRGSLIENNPELIEEWNYEKNIDIEPNKISAHSSLKVWWKCKKCKFEWVAQISNRANGSGCPSCAKNRK